VATAGHVASRVSSDERDAHARSRRRGHAVRRFAEPEIGVLSLLVCAVQQMPKIFPLGQQHAFEIRFFRHGKKHRTRPAVFVITTDFSNGNSLIILLSLSLTSRKLSIFIIQTKALVSLIMWFCVR
jgi:hypothetical protein